MAREEPRVVTDRHNAKTLHSMGSQSNPQLMLKKKLARKKEV